MEAIEDGLNGLREMLNGLGEEIDVLDQGAARPVPDANAHVRLVNVHVRLALRRGNAGIVVVGEVRAREPPLTLTLSPLTWGEGTHFAQVRALPARGARSTVPSPHVSGERVRVRGGSRAAVASRTLPARAWRRDASLPRGAARITTRAHPSFVVRNSRDCVTLIEGLNH